MEKKNISGKNLKKKNNILEFLPKNSIFGVFDNCPHTWKQGILSTGGMGQLSGNFGYSFVFFFNLEFFWMRELREKQKKKVFSEMCQFQNHFGIQIMEEMHHIFFLELWFYLSLRKNHQTSILWHIFPITLEPWI